MKGERDMRPEPTSPRTAPAVIFSISMMREDGRTIQAMKAGGTMRHIPYGYWIENGRAVIDEEQAATVREFFQNYISGMALMPAAEKAGLKLYHGSAGRMLRNKKYLGDDYYPAIIDKENL